MASTITEQLGWRWCSKCQGLWYAGSAACPASGCHDHTGSGDYSLAHDLPSSPIRQTDWKWCSKCQVLSFVQHVTGACSGGDLHDTGGSLNYTLDVGTSPGQQNWKWCNKCFGLAYTGDSHPGKCQKDGGEHDHSTSGNYTLSLDGIPANGGQDQWRICSKCRLLAFDGHSSCTTGGAHINTESGHYILTFSPGGQGQQNWKWCNKCYGLSFAGNQSLGRCAKGEMHDHKGSGDYRIMNNVDNPHGFPPAGFQNKWSWCNKCQLLWFSGNGANVRCPQGPLAFHDNTGSADYAIRME